MKCKNCIQLIINTKLPLLWTRKILYKQFNLKEDAGLQGPEDKPRQDKRRRLPLPDPGAVSPQSGSRTSGRTSKSLSAGDTDIVSVQADIKVRPTGLRSSDIIIEIDNVNDQDLHKPETMKIMRALLWRMYSNLKDNLSKS